MYWIDPNGGTIKDAIWVYCDKSKNSSCVYPKHPQVMQTLLLAQCGGACVSQIQRQSLRLTPLLRLCLQGGKRVTLALAHFFSLYTTCLQGR